MIDYTRIAKTIEVTSLLYLSDRCRITSWLALRFVLSSFFTLSLFYLDRIAIMWYNIVKIHGGS